MTRNTQRRGDRTSSDAHQIQRQQYQKQRQQQQQQQDSYAALGRDLPEKQHQSKHNAISEAAQFGVHSCDQ